MDLEPRDETDAKAIAKETNDRHRLWLNRGRRLGAKKLATWRPRPVYRANALKVLRAAGTQLEVATPSGGLKMFIRLPKDDLWASENWESWPYLALNFDHASENVCAYNYLDRFLNGNTDLFGDPSHGANRDTLLSLDRSGLKQFLQVMMVSWNLPHGPADDDSWSNLLDEVIVHLEKTYSRGNLPVFVLGDGAKNDSELAEIWSPI